MPIRIRNFGGLRPKDTARALPDDSAQTAENLQSNLAVFRPLAGDEIVVADSGVEDPLTIFRLQRNADGSLNTTINNAANWKIYAADVNLVKGPLNDDTNDRYYLTYNDGTTPPRVIDCVGADRQLGVPAPEDAPELVVNVVDEFTVEERNLALTALRQSAVEMIRANATAVWVGDTHPGLTTSGYLDHVTTLGFQVDVPNEQIRAYKLTSATGVVSDAYSAVDDAEFSWIFDPLLAPFVGAAPDSSLTWAAYGTYHLCISFISYGRIYELDTATLETQLATLEMPGDPENQALTGDQIDDLLARLDAFVDPDGEAVKPKIDALHASVGRLKVLLDGGARVSIAASTQAFYSKTDVAAAVTDAIANAAEAIWAAADGIARSSLPADYTGPEVIA